MANTRIDPPVNPKPSANQRTNRPDAGRVKSLPSAGPNFTRGLDTKSGPPIPNSPYRR